MSINPTMKAVAGTQLVHCCGLGVNVKKGRLTAILPHMAVSVNAAGLCDSCQEVQNKAREKGAGDKGLVDDKERQTIHRWVKDAKALPAGFKGNKLSLRAAEKLLTTGQFLELEEFMAQSGTAEEEGVKPFVLTPTKIAEDEQPGFDLYAVFDVVRIKGPVEEDDETEDSGTRIYRGGRTAGPAGEKYKKPTRRFVASFAQKQGCLCAICGREFGIDIVKGNKPPTTLGATFEHWIPDVYLVNTQKSVAERNKNTQDSRNCITCGVCNLAKSDQMGDPDAGIPLTMEQAREISVLAWKPWRVISRDEALTLEGKRLTRKYGIEINVGVVA